MKTVFMGTPAIAVASLRALAEVSDVVGVVCQPDRPAGRGMKTRPCAVKAAAEELGLQVHQPVKVRTGSLPQWLANTGAEAVVVLAYGRILPPSVLSTPRLGCLNLHASLLPRYRGAAPINWAIAQGEKETGVSLMQMAEGLDTGPVYCARKQPINDTMDAGDLAIALGDLSALMVKTDVPRVFQGLTPIPQNEAEATFAPPLTADNTRVDWGLPAQQIVNRIRAFAPKPGAHTSIRGKRLKLWGARTSTLQSSEQLAPGEVRILSRSHLLVGTGCGAIDLERAQLEGRKPLGAADLINGRTLADGDRLGS